MIGKIGHFGGYFWQFWGCGGGLEGPAWENYPYQMWMSMMKKRPWPWPLHDSISRIQVGRGVDAV